MGVYASSGFMCAFSRKEKSKVKKTHTETHSAKWRRKKSKEILLKVMPPHILNAKYIIYITYMINTRISKTRVIVDMYYIRYFIWWWAMRQICLYFYFNVVAHFVLPFLLHFLLLWLSAVGSVAVVGFFSFIFCINFTCSIVFAFLLRVFFRLSGKLSSKAYASRTQREMYTIKVRRYLICFCTKSHELQEKK